MPKPIDEDRARRKALLEEKRLARKAAKEEEAKKKALVEKAKKEKEEAAAAAKKKAGDGPSLLLRLPEDAVRCIFSLLPAADLGCLTMSCKSMNQMLSNARLSYLLSRLHRPNTHTEGAVGYINLLRDESEARDLIKISYGGGNTGRIEAKGRYGKKVPNEFISFARFLEEVVSGFSILSTGNRANPIVLPRFVQGRVASVSPEHSLCRVGGDGAHCGAGGSGVASWGVGRRGQLGHGKRADERAPKMLIGGIGYSTRIVQVSAGGGLVRVAHSLLLTSTGRVLSFGTGQYGALGHGYSAAKQLPDTLRPKYIEGLAGVRCVCVAAGELHSAVVTSDGDVYAWGDGFCGQVGMGDKRPQLTPKQVTLGGLEDECVANVVCGSRHTIAVTEDGDAFSWGLGHFGVLGRSFTPFDYDADAAVVAFTGGVGGDDEMPVAVAARPEINNVHDQPAPLGAGSRGEQVEADAELLAHLDLIANLSLDDSSDQCYPKRVESLEGIKIVGASAGHRHTLLLDDHGSLYSCGTGSAGCLGHGDTVKQMYPMKITTFDDDNIKIAQMSAGVDMSMAVATTGQVYGWGRTDGGRIGLGLVRGEVTIPRLVPVTSADGTTVKGVDVECGYVHSLVVGIDGTLHMCGGVGIDGESDGQSLDEDLSETIGKPRSIPDFNIWHRVPEPQEVVHRPKWKKLGKYEIKGRSKNS